MKQIVTYINEKANFLVKKHVKHTTHELEFSQEQNIENFKPYIWYYLRGINGECCIYALSETKSVHDYTAGDGIHLKRLIVIRYDNDKKYYELRKANDNVFYKKYWYSEEVPTKLVKIITDVWDNIKNNIDEYESMQNVKNIATITKKGVITYL